jgi:hypothetical protein
MKMTYDVSSLSQLLRVFLHLTGEEQVVRIGFVEVEVKAFCKCS